jgi:hypothetical protein
LRGFRFFGAPHAAVLTSETGVGVYGAVEVKGYAQVLSVATQTNGVRAIPQVAPANHGDVLKSIFGIAPELSSYDASRLVMRCGASHKSLSHHLRGAE